LRATPKRVKIRLKNRILSIYVDFVKRVRHMVSPQIFFLT